MNAGKSVMQRMGKELDTGTEKFGNDLSIVLSITFQNKKNKTLENFYNLTSPKVVLREFVRFHFRNTKRTSKLQNWAIGEGNSEEENFGSTPNI